MGPLKNLERIRKFLWQNSPSDWVSRCRKANRVSNNLSEGYRDELQTFWCLSTGRVGSQTLAAVGKLSSQLMSCHEPKPNLYQFGQQIYLKSEYKSCAVAEAGFFACRQKILSRAALRNCSYLETSPQITFLAREISTVLTNSRFIHLSRHPSEVVVSGMRRGWYKDNRNDEWRIAPSEEVMGECWENLSQFEKNLWLWNETNSWISEFLKEIDEGRSLTIKAEDIFSNHDETFEKLFAFLGVERPSYSRLEKVLGKKLNHQKQGNFQPYDNWTARQRDLLLKYCGTTMQEMGYC